jgi:hypothetical protein
MEKGFGFTKWDLIGLSLDKVLVSLIHIGLVLNLSSLLSKI